MKKHPVLLSLAFASLTFGSITSAAPLQFPHEHLKFASATTIYEMIADGGVHVKVTKQCYAPLPGKLARHEVTISTDSDGPHSFSLLTLGVQSVTHDTIIVSAPTGPAGATFAALAVPPAQTSSQAVTPPPPASTQPIDPVNGRMVPATGYTDPGPGAPPQNRTVNADKVWFIVFNGKECKLIIEPQPDYVWTTVWVTNTGPQEGHGTTTPD